MENCGCHGYLFSHAVSTVNLCSVELNKRIVVDEVIGKEGWSWPILIYHPRIFLESLRRATKYFKIVSAPSEIGTGCRLNASHEPHVTVPIAYYADNVPK
jgi:hypothetical protein